VLLIIIILLVLRCTSGIVPKTSKIRVAYLGSVYKDIYSKNPVCAGLPSLPGIKIAHTMTEPVFLEHFLYRAGLDELLNTLEIDFVITDTVTRGQNFFGIPKAAGYAITNLEGIRFAMFAASNESLTIEDQVQLTLVRERSDILWVIDPSLLDLEPTLISFQINNRMLSDTSMAPLNPIIDTTRRRMIQDFTSKVDQELGRKIHLGGPLDEHLFSSISSKNAVNVILYPENLILKILDADSTNLRELFDCIAFETKFRRARMTDEEISETRASNNLMTWGEIKAENDVLLPDESTGQRIYDYYYIKE
jgi:hypothetical protein